MINFKYLLAGFSCATLLALAPSPVEMMDVPQVYAEEISTADETPTPSPDSTEKPEVTPGETTTPKETANPEDTTTPKETVAPTETSDIYEMSVSAKYQYMTLQAGENTKIYVSFPTVKDGTIKKDGVWTSYDVVGDEVNVDLSSKKIDKEFYVQVKGNETGEVVVYHFSPSTSKVKATVDNADNKLGAKVTFTDKDKNAVTGTFEYCTSNGSWVTYNENSTDLSMYQENGATLRFRKAADPSVTVKKGNSLTPSSGTGTVTTYEVDGVFASNEVKAKIGKRATGPKITVDYKNHTFTVAKGNYAIYQGTEKIIVNEGNATGKVTVDGSKAIGEADGVLAEFKGETAAIIAEDGAIEAWVGIDTAKKKPRSAYSIVEFDGIKTLTTKEGAVSIADNYVVEEGKENSTEKVTASSTLSSGKNATTYDITIKNDTGNAYEVVVASTKPAADVKATSVKAKKDTTIKKVTGTDHVWVRLAADTKNKVWSSDYVDMGVVANASDSTEQPGTTEQPDATEQPGTTEQPDATEQPSEQEKAITLTVDGESSSSQLVVTASEDLTSKSESVTAKLDNGTGELEAPSVDGTKITIKKTSEGTFDTDDKVTITIDEISKTFKFDGSSWTEEENE